MKIFITGGTGFIGKPVVQMLLSQGHSLAILYRSIDLKLLTPENKDRIKLIRGDLSDINRWSYEVRLFQPDAMIHLAWEGIPDYGAEQSIKNLNYSLELLNLMAKVGCKKVLAVGSCWEYEPIYGAIDEDGIISENNPFILAKHTIQRFGEMVAEQKNQEFIWVRPFYVYGPGQKKSSIIPYLIDCKLWNKEPEIKNPNACHDFVYIDDVAVSIVLLINQIHNPGSSTFNTGSGELTSIKEIFEIIFPGHDWRYFPDKNKVGMHADISRLISTVNWVPQMGIERGIQETIKYFESLKT